MRRKPKVPPEVVFGCRACGQEFTAFSISGMFMEYIPHLTAEHWEHLQYMHDNPEAVKKGQEYLKEQGWV